MITKPIIIKVTFIGDNFTFSVEDDCTDYVNDLIECNNIFSNTGMPMTEENIMDFFKEGTFTDEKINSLNGSHFISGFLEAYWQNKRCPDFLYSYFGKMKYKFELVNS